MSLARAKFVKKANKDNPVAKKGESYWYWSHFRGPKCYSKEAPRNSQLESNENVAAAYEVEEELVDWKPLPREEGEKPKDRMTRDAVNANLAELAGLRDDWVSRLEDAASEEQDKLDNLPEQFQEGDTGSAIQERIDAINDFAQELENVDLDEIEESDDPEFNYEDEFDNRFVDLQACSYGG